ncbi:MAG: hypothetical protein Q4C60_07875 [Eubacteriales bacterium]|nr:hypothetical protein [Eubacteriales bacterium]
MQEIKELFKRVRRERKALEELMRERERLTVTLQPKAVMPKLICVQTSPKNTMEETVPEIVEQDRKIEAAKERLRRDTEAAMRIIQRITRKEYRILLQQYYLGEEKTLARVGEEIGYSLRQTKRLHAAALAAAQQIVKDGTF